MTEITREQLAKALGDMTVTIIDKDGLKLRGGSYRADTLVTSAEGPLMCPGELAGMLLDDIAEKRPDGGGIHPTGPHLTDADLCARVGEISECRVSGPRCDRIGGPCTCPDPEFAPTPVGADPELAAIARILAELDALDGESGAGRQSALRALTYVASRYGYVLADED